MFLARPVPFCQGVVVVGNNFTGISVHFAISECLCGIGEARLVSVIHLQVISRVASLRRGVCLFLFQKRFVDAKADRRSEAGPIAGMPSAHVGASLNSKPAKST